MSFPKFDEYDIFISYRNDESTLARLVKNELLAEKLTVFLDKDDLGQCDFDEKLERVIRNCGYFIIVLTEGSLDRMREKPDDYCLKEIQIALDAKREIILVAASETMDMDRKSFPESIRAVASQNAVIYHHIHHESFRKDLVSRIDRTRRRALASVEWNKLTTLLKSESYRHWQLEYIKTLYGPQDDASRTGGEAEFFPRIAGVSYPIVIYRAADSQTPFEHDNLCSGPVEFRDIVDLPDLNAYPLAPIPEWVLDGDRDDLRKQYFQILSYTRSVRRWNMRGFALSALELDDQHRVTGYKARLCTYGENCLTSHVLGYELCSLYEKGMPPDALLAPVMLRPDIALTGGNNTAGSEVLKIPDEGVFSPLISVQGLVVYRDPLRGRNWRMVVMERTASVAASPGFWQFPPAGGFEILGTERANPLHIKQQFNMKTALIRELLEEIFGDADMTGADQTAAPQALDGSEGFQHIYKSLQKQTGGMSIHLLGVVTDLVSLRSEFSFLILIEDPSLMELRYTVHESKGIQHKVQWMRGSDESHGLSSVGFDEIGELLSPGNAWNPPSAGLLRLFAELTNDKESWLKTQHPDMPELVLPA